MKTSKPQDLKLSTAGKVIVSLSLAYMGSAAVAANIEAIGQTSVSQKGGVDIVNIAAPNAQGLSHNQYNKYNVAKEGAVLNNSLTNGKSQLAGDLAANSNFRNQAAAVILNEVVSKNPSLILGKQEVFGMAADYVLANPNGITHQNGSIVNTKSATLVVGKAELENGRLAAVRTGDENSAAALKVNGTLDGVDAVNLIAPKVIVGNAAKVEAKESINVLSGANKVNLATGTTEKLAQGNKAPVLDGQVFGSMRAGSIRVHSTDSRGTQLIRGNLNASGDLNVESDGKLHIQAANLAGKDVNLFAKSTKVDGIVNTHRDRNGNTSKDRKNVVSVTSGATSTQTFAGSVIKADGVLTLKNTESVSLKGAKITAGDFQVDAKELSTAAEVTTNASNSQHNQKKGLWFNNANSRSQSQTVHTTDINSAGKVVVQAENVALSGTQVTAGAEVKVQAQNAISMNGVKSRNSANEIIQFKNESGKLKTGHASKGQSLESYHATQIKAGGNVVLDAKKAVNLTGAKVHAGGNLFVDAKRAQLSTESTTDFAQVDDKAKYWGGLAGARDGKKDLINETIHGAALTADGVVLVDSRDGLKVHGSAVKGKNGSFLSAGSGKAEITNAVATNRNVSSERIGTVFNITKKRSNTESTVQTATGSVLQSDADVRVIAEKDVNLVGSSIQATRDLQIETKGNVNVAAAALKSQYNSSSFDIKPVAKGNVDVKGAEISGGVGLSFIKQSSNSQVTTHAGSAVNAGNDVAINSAKNVTIKGSTVAAKGDVNVKAQNISTVAAKDVNNTTATKRVTDIGIGVAGALNGGTPSVTLSAGISSGYNKTDTAATTAKVSGVSGNNINLNAKQNISHQGTAIKAVNTVTETAKKVTHTAANNTVNTNTVEHKGGIGVSIGANSGKVLNAKLGIHGSGGTSAENAQTVGAVTTITAGGDVNVNAAEKATDIGTVYNSASNVNIKTGTYVNEAATETSTKVSNKGGAEISVGASTSDFATIDLSVGGKVSYQHEHGSATKAVKGTISGENVSVEADKTATIAANVFAKDKVELSAKEGVTLTESKNTASTVGGGFELGANVGVKVIPAAGVAAPSAVGGNVAVNYGHNKSTQGVGSVVKGNDVNIQGGTKVDIQGADIEGANSVTIKGDKVSSAATTSKRDVVGVNVGVHGGVDFSDAGSISKFNVGGDVKVNREKEDARGKNEIKGGTVEVTGNSAGAGVSLEGTNVSGGKVSVTNSNPNGTVSTTDVSSSSSKVNVGLGMELNGAIETKKWTETWTEKWKDMCGYDRETVHVREHSEKVTKLIPTPKITIPEIDFTPPPSTTPDKPTPPTTPEKPPVKIPPSEKPPVVSEQPPAPPAPQPPVVTPPQPQPQPPVVTPPQPPVAPSQPQPQPGVQDGQDSEFIS